MELTFKTTIGESDFPVEVEAEVIDNGDTASIRGIYVCDDIGYEYNLLDTVNEATLVGLRHEAKQQYAKERGSST